MNRWVPSGRKPAARRILSEQGGERKSNIKLTRWRLFAQWLVSDVGECIAGDKRRALQNRLPAENRDLALKSEVFYYSSAGFLTFWRYQPARNNGLTSSDGILELV